MTRLEATRPAGNPKDPVVEATTRLLNYCQARDWAGYDPYDALNSAIFNVLPLLNVKPVRLVLTQAMKRFPFNLRPMLLVPATHNPKGLALFLKAFLKLARVGLPGQKELAGTMVEKLEALRAPGTRYWSWGYSFPWQGRNLLVPRGTPNLICTTFVADALLDLYEDCGDERLLQMAKGAADYLSEELYWSEKGPAAGFSYPLPSSRSQVHNANFLGAALLCRVYRLSGERKYLEPALKVARYSASRQRADGSWLYGELPTQGWIDNFHTGYNLCGLRAIGQFAEINEFEKHVELGLEFYRGHFFEENGAPKYFHDRTFPLDVHSVAQSIITLLTFKDLDQSGVRQAHAVMKWAMGNLSDERGYFYHQKLAWGTIKIPYMRWGQAWMLLALATLLEDGSGNSEPGAQAKISKFQEAIV